MTDISAVTEAAIDLIVPALPYLTSAATTAAEEGAKALTKEAWQRARGLWRALGKDKENAAELERAARVATAMPDDEDFRVALRAQIRLLLAIDRELAAEAAGQAEGEVLHEGGLAGTGIAEHDQAIG